MRLRTMKQGGSPKLQVALLLKHDAGSFRPVMGGGTEHVFAEDIRMLRRRGYTVSAYARFSLSEPRVIALRHGTRLLRLVAGITDMSWPKLNRFRVSVQQFARILSELQYVYQFATRHPKDPVVGYSTFILPLFRKHAVILVHDKQALLFPGLCASRYRESTYLFCSKYLRRSYTRRYPGIFHDRNSDVLYNAVPPEFTGTPHEVTRRHGPIRFLYCGAWAEEKGLNMILSAFRALRRRNNITLTIASHPRSWYLDFPYEQTLFIRKMRELVRTLPAVTELGGVAHGKLPAIYRAHDYTLVPSVWEEPFGMVALESIACATPVIAFASGGIPEILSPDNAIVVPANTRALSDIIAAIASGKVRRDKPVMMTEKNSQMRQVYRAKRFAYVLRNVASA